MKIHKKLMLNVKRPISKHIADIIAWTIATDGHISLIKHKCRSYLGFLLKPRIAVTNTESELINKLEKMVGGSKTQYYKKNPKWKNGLRLQITSLKDVKYLLEKILPHLPIKRKRAKLLLEFCNSRLQRGKHTHYSKRELEIFKEMKELNKRGNK